MTKLCKNEKTAHIVEIYVHDVAYEADIDEGDGEYMTDTIKQSDILYAFVKTWNSKRQ